MLPGLSNQRLPTERYELGISYRSRRLEEKASLSSCSCENQDEPWCPFSFPGLKDDFVVQDFCAICSLFEFQMDFQWVMGAKRYLRGANTYQRQRKYEVVQFMFYPYPHNVFRANADLYKVLSYVSHPVANLRKRDACSAKNDSIILGVTFS